MLSRLEKTSVYSSTRILRIIGELFWKANKMKKDNMITSTWTMDRNIFVKTSPSGAPVRIYCVEDLDDL